MKVLDDEGDRNDGYAPLQNYTPLQSTIEGESDDSDGAMDGDGGGGNPEIPEHVQVNEEDSASRLLALLEADYARCIMSTSSAAHTVVSVDSTGAHDVEGEREVESAIASKSVANGAGVRVEDVAEGSDDGISLDVPVERPIVDQPRGGSIPLTNDDADRITRIVSQFTLNLPDSFEPRSAWAAQLNRAAQTAPGTKVATQK